MSLFYKNSKTYLLSTHCSLVSYCAHAFIIKQKLETNDGFLYKMYFLPHPKAKLRQHSQKLSEEKKVH